MITCSVTKSKRHILILKNTINIGRILLDYFIENIKTKLKSFNS